MVPDQSPIQDLDLRDGGQHCREPVRTVVAAACGCAPIDRMQLCKAPATRSGPADREAERPDFLTPFLATPSILQDCSTT